MRSRAFNRAGQLFNVEDVEMVNLSPCICEQSKVFKSRKAVTGLWISNVFAVHGCICSLKDLYM